MADRQARLRLYGGFAEPGRARTAVREFCEGMPGYVIETAEVLASELATNAVEHGSGRRELTVTLTDHTLCVEVSDESPEQPRVMPNLPDLSNGRGLIVVGALAAEWGVTPSVDGPGKSVWATLPTR